MCALVGVPIKKLWLIKPKMRVLLPRCLLNTLTTDFLNWGTSAFACRQWKYHAWRLQKVNAVLPGLNAVPRTVRCAQNRAHTGALSCTNRLFVTFTHYNDTEAAGFLQKLVSFPCILALYCRFMSSESWWWFPWRRRGEPWLWSDGWNASLPAPASRSNSLTASPRCLRSSLSPSARNT